MKIETSLILDLMEILQDLNIKVEGLEKEIKKLKENSYEYRPYIPVFTDKNNDNITLYSSKLINKL